MMTSVADGVGLGFACPDDGWPVKFRWTALLADKLIPCPTLTCAKALWGEGAFASPFRDPSSQCDSRASPGATE